MPEMTPEIFKELVVKLEGTYKDFSQRIYMHRYQIKKDDPLRKGMCRALAGAYIAKNHRKALGNSFEVEPFSRLLKKSSH